MGTPDRVVILNDFSSAEGGAAYLAVELACGMAARGTLVSFICGDAGGDPIKGVETVALGGRPLIDGRAGPQALRGLWNRAAAVRVRDWISLHDTPRTIYHLHNWSNILSPSIFSALAPVAGRCAIHAHDFFLACPNGAYLDYPRAAICDRQPLSLDCIATNCDKRVYVHKLWRATRQRILQRALGVHLARATFVMIHPAMRPWLNRAIQPANMIAIRNPVTAFGPQVEAPERQRRFVHIGQIQRLKGVFELAEVGRRLGVEIDFFGGGEDLAELSARYSEHAWHGFTARAEIARRLKETRAVVIATQSPEPFCLAAFESVATGVPLVISDSILAAPELVQSGVALSFRGADARSLAEVMSRVTASDALVKRLAKATRATVPRPGLAQWIDAHAKLYARLLGQPDCTSPEDKMSLLSANGEAFVPAGLTQ